MTWLKRGRRIAVTGLSGSGKTVFLLSLLQNIEHFDSRRFRLAGGGATGAFRELAGKADGWPIFPRSRLQAGLMRSREAAWPEKTGRIHQFRCSFDYRRREAGGWLGKILPGARRRRRVLEWEFLDFPGERFSDALIARHPDFPAWSDALLGLWEMGEPRPEALADYLALQRADRPVGAEELLLGYKRRLSAGVSGKNQLITPSAFMLAPDRDSPLTAEDVRNGGAARLSGLPGGEFSPLTRDFRASRPDLTEIFSRHYARYREELVLPIFAAINGCDTLLVTVDIPGILSGGSGRYHDAGHLLEALADNLAPSGWFSRGIRRLGLIAAKSDMIHPRDRDSLKSLADDLLRLLLNRRPEIRRAKAFTVAAWASAKSADLEDGGRALQGVPAREGGSDLRLFRVPELKPVWPVDWGPEDPAYSYPRLAPARLTNRFAAPDQWNLEKVFDFILA
ncbi:MAG: YcjX family protein [Planctomycetota bacterium]|jgi:predicted YcjX-like family ATPase|nr:YcjX family protein [Planctomycetota bacterium]